ncbi:metallophosphoesterase family protein [Qipengyuania sp. XHP0207]|uniref:metallophosphoesterase family protein n=1 Tax=Qipengyuania sp. XHP0207 TaxID=3038078 RepID=UPI00241CE37F|nr:metallophosphoesterase family protein [Qipengyuania sp. XHP0207]MDG5749114.1 metallophosphoesterase family protein [Qipengyuania sp. XHP0207]
MLRSLRQLFKERPAARRVARVPEGERYYVIGDVHGRLDLFESLIEAIEADDAASGTARSTVILLGDLIDRGPDSRGVIERARDWGKTRSVRYIAGNHEEMFLDSFDDKEMLRHFVKHGGRETILSYGIKRKRYNELTIKELQEHLAELIPAEDREFLAGFEDMIVAGDYVFVHAGLNPKRSLEEQRQTDLRWIRERFLKHSEPFSHVVVHGHTIFEDIERTDHRIGIDTGAFRTGRLTALVLEGEERRTIQAIEVDGSLAIAHGAMD